MTQPQTGPVQAAASLEEAVDSLRADGLRVSAARRLLLEALFAASGPVTAERIADGLDGRLTRSDLTSVYRNLETLEELGLVRHFHRGHGAGLYSLAGREGFGYLVCDSCGATEAVEPAAMEAVRDLVRARFGYEARFTHFPIVGLCPGCAPSGPAAKDADRTEEDPSPYR